MEWSVEEFGNEINGQMGPRLKWRIYRVAGTFGYFAELSLIGDTQKRGRLVQPIESEARVELQE